MAGAATGGAQQRAETSSSRNALLAFLQPVAMGVLLGQGWHVYSEVWTRGSQVGFGVCCAGAALGLLVSMFLCHRATPGQAALRLSFFWMACTLTGGLAGIAQLRLRVGRFRSNDDALVVNSFLSSALLGTALPYIVMKIVRQPGADVLMPCVLAVLMTEAICSSESTPILQVGVSLFLFSVGLQGIVSDSGLPVGGLVGEASKSGSRPAIGAAGEATPPFVHEPFFPATALDKRCYSPHFLVSRKQHSVPNVTNVVPLIELVVRPVSSEPSRGSGERGSKGKGGKGERRSRDRESESEVLAALPTGPDFEQKPAAGEGSSDIRWDMLFETGATRKASGDEPQRVDSASSQQQLEGAGIDDAVEVCAELAVDKEEENMEAGPDEEALVMDHKGSSASQGSNSAVPLAIQQRLEQALAAARDLESSDPPPWREEEEQEVAQEADIPGFVRPSSEAGHERQNPEFAPESLSAPRSAPLTGLVLTQAARGSLDSHGPESDDGLEALPFSGATPAFSSSAAAFRSRQLNVAAEEFVPGAPIAQVQSSSLSLFADDPPPAAAPSRGISLFADDPAPVAAPKSSLSLFADEPAAAAPPKSSLSLFADEPAAAAPPHRSLSLFADDPPDAAAAETQAQENEVFAAAPFGHVHGHPPGQWLGQEGQWDATQNGSDGAAAMTDEQKAWAEAQGYTGDPSTWGQTWGDAAAWEGFGYGDMTNQAFPAGYGYEAGAEGYLNEAGEWVVGSASYSQFQPGAPSTWDGAEGQEQVEGNEEDEARKREDAALYARLCPISKQAEHSSVPEAQAGEPREAAFSLFDDEAPDPGCGRASVVRQIVDEERKGKGGKRTGNRDQRSDQPRTLWVGDVEQRMTEDYIGDIFSTLALVTGVKIIRDRGSGYNGQGYAFVELSSHNAAMGVLQTLNGQPVVGKDGKQLRVNWASERQGEERRPKETEAAEVWDQRGVDMRADPRRTDARRDPRRSGYEGDGRAKGGDAWEAYRDNNKGGKEDGRKGGGKGGKDSRRTTDNTRKELDGGRNDTGGGGKGGLPNPLLTKCWAYMDPHGEIQGGTTGFSTDEMRQWFDLGYFEADLQVGLMQEGKGGNKKVPTKREFYALKQWFSDLSKAFTFVPRF